MMNRLTTDELKQMRSELRLSQKEMGELIGVDRGVYNNFEARAVPLKYVDQIIDAYQREKSKLRNMVDKKYTDVYYNEDEILHEDSARARLLDLGKALARRETVQVTAFRIPVSGAWSAKGMPHVTKIINAVLGAASDFIVIDEQLNNLSSGALLVFQPTEYPQEDTYLLFQSRIDPDKKLLGWITPDKPSEIQSGMNSFPISDWQVTGWAYAIAWGLGDTLDDHRASSRGIGPRTRI